MPTRAPSAAGASSRRHALAVVLLLLLTALALGNVLGHDFIHFDDDKYVTDNIRVQQGLTASNVYWAVTESYISYWHPVTWLSHMLDVELFGVNGPRHHIQNLLWHAVNGLLLYSLLWRMTRAWALSLLVAAVWAVHPLRVEVVGWVSERKEVLCVLLMLVTLHLYVSYAARPGIGRFVAVMVAFFVGMMAKPAILTLPAVLLLLDLWPLRRWAPANRWFQADAISDPSHDLPRLPQASLGRLLLEKAMLMPLVLGIAAMTLVGTMQGAAIGTAQTHPWALRMVNVPMGYLLYLYRHVVPMDLTIFYPFDFQAPMWKGWAAWGGVLGITLVMLWQARRRPHLIVGWLIYLGTLVPVVGIVQAGSQANANRYTYQTTFFLLLAVGLLVREAWLRLKLRLGPQRAKAVGVGLAVLLMAGLTVKTHAESRYYRNSLALFTRALEIDESNYIAWNVVGYWYTQVEPDPVKARQAYERSIELSPGNLIAGINLSIVYWLEESPERGMAMASEMVRIWPDSAYTHATLSYMLLVRNQLDRAAEHAAMALQRDPLDTRAGAVWDLAAERLAQRGTAVTLDDPRASSALTYLRTTDRYKMLRDSVLTEERRRDALAAQAQEKLAANPDDPEALLAKGTHLILQQQIDEALPVLRRAADLRPEDPRALFNYARALGDRGRLEESLEALHELIARHPDMAVAYQQRGNVLGRMGRTSQAVADLEKALTLNPQLATARTNLAILRQRQEEGGEQGPAHAP